MGLRWIRCRSQDTLTDDASSSVETPQWGESHRRAIESRPAVPTHGALKQTSCEAASVVGGTSVSPVPPVNSSPRSELTDSGFHHRRSSNTSGGHPSGSAVCSARSVRSRGCLGVRASAAHSEFVNAYGAGFSLSAGSLVRPALGRCDAAGMTEVSRVTLMFSAFVDRLAALVLLFAPHISWSITGDRSAIARPAPFGSLLSACRLGLFRTVGGVFDGAGETGLTVSGRIGGLYLFLVPLTACHRVVTRCLDPNSDERPPLTAVVVRASSDSLFHKVV